MAIDTKERIMKTAFRLFLENGYKNTSLRIIAEACNTSHVNILHHFHGKIELGKKYLHMYSESVAIETSLLVRKHSLESWIERFATFWMLHFTFLITHDAFCTSYYEIESENRFTMPEVALRNVSNTAENYPILTEPEASLNMYLLTEAELQLLRMIHTDEITMLYAMQYVLKIVMKLLLNRVATEEEIEDIIKKVQKIDYSDAIYHIEYIFQK